MNYGLIKEISNKTKQMRRQLIRFLKTKFSKKIISELEKRLNFYKKNGLNEKEYGFNGKSTIVKKVQENKKLNLPGIMFWQLAGDVEVNSEYSLLRAINKNLK